MAGSTIQGLIALNYEDYVWKQWHGTLLTIAVIAAGIIFNTVLSAYLSKLEGFLLVFHILGLFIIVVPLWIMAPKGSASDVLLTFDNNGGWQTTGLAAMIGLNGPLGTTLGFDCSAHMAEELRDASRIMPRAVMWSCVLNFALTFTILTTVIFCVGNTDNIDELLATKTGSPWIQLVLNTTQSYRLTNAMVSVVAILLICCTFNEVTTSSRQVWSFSRDGYVT